MEKRDEMADLAGRDIWLWRSNVPQADWPTCGAPVAVEVGDDVTVMFHGGSIARGNLVQSLSWGAVTAYKYHGRTRFSDLDTARELVWLEKPRFSRRICDRKRWPAIEGLAA
jgi:hypothetical protein